MIAEDTVLILGAGTSVDYQYPLGRKLIMDISEQLTNQNSSLYKLLIQCHFQPQHITDFKDDLRACNLPSIDAFLENRDEFEKIGKSAIAGMLIPCENESYLSRTGWYEYLHGRLMGRKEEFYANRLKVVTFNYDQSFEAALFLALKKSYKLSDAECANYMNVIPVIHVYGQLGELPYRSTNGRPYNQNINEEVINQCIGAIRIVHEGADDTPEFQQAQEAIRTAEVVCCLGFGYHQENVNRLNLSQVSQGPQSKRVYLSAYGFTLRQSQRLGARIFPGGYSRNIQFGGERQTVLDFLRETAALE